MKLELIEVAKNLAIELDGLRKEIVTISSYGIDLQKVGFYVQPNGTATPYYREFRKKFIASFDFKKTYLSFLETEIARVEKEIESL